MGAAECLALQGFEFDAFRNISRTDAVCMAGNAVPRPVGHFAVLATTEVGGFDAAAVKTRIVAALGL